MQVEEVKFSTFKSNVKKKEGIVLLGAGGNPQEWIDGVTKMLNDENIATGKADKIWNHVYMLKTSGGRTDLAFVSNNCLSDFAVGKMAIWRIKVNNDPDEKRRLACFWISDYVTNYAKQFTFNSDGTPYQ